MTAYLVWRGMSMEAIGVWRGIASAWGLIGTLAYNFLTKRINLVDTGMISVVFQFTFVSLGYLSLFVDDKATSLGMLMVAICFSRVGLWVFDIAITQVRYAAACAFYILFILMMGLKLATILILPN